MLFKNEAIDPQKVKNRSEKIILSAGGEILDWLPALDLPEPREGNDLINRALVLNAMYQLHMKAPKSYIKGWIENNFLTDELTSKECSILTSSNELTEEDHYELFWSLESLWAIAWATNLIHDLSFKEQVGRELASLSPNLQLNEDGHKYRNNMKLRSVKSLFEMLDLYYRLHWWASQLSKKESCQKNEMFLNTIAWRRKALEWILNSDQEWDQIDLSI